MRGSVQAAAVRGAAVSTRSRAWRCWSIWTTRRRRCANWRAWRAAPSWSPCRYEPYFQMGNVLRGKHLSAELGNHPEHVQHWNLRTFREISSRVVSLRACIRGADRRSISLDHRLLPSKPTLIFLAADGDRRGADRGHLPRHRADLRRDAEYRLRDAVPGSGALRLRRVSSAAGAPGDGDWPVPVWGAVAEVAGPLAGRQRRAQQRAALFGKR